MLLRVKVSERGEHFGAGGVGGLVLVASVGCVLGAPGPVEREVGVGFGLAVDAAAGGEEQIEAVLNA